jgi:tryptophan 2,3-dioxygenase
MMNDCVAELNAWLDSRDPEAFPFEAVVAEYHRATKQFVPENVLAALHRVRASLAGQPDPRMAELTAFLSTALDKWDGRYDYPTYIALGLLPLPTVADIGGRPGEPARRRDRLVAMLVADTLRFELAAEAGETELFPEMRPSAEVVAKRCRLGLRVLRPAAGRLGLHEATCGDRNRHPRGAGDARAEARKAWQGLERGLSAAERRTLQLSILPVYRIHDEYMFIRVLQSYEATFALMAVTLCSGVRRLADGDAEAAVRSLTDAESILRESAPLFSLLVTMRGAAFRIFRQFTEGASAIQSRSYKTVESLCRTPDRARLDSPAYLAVPEVQERVLLGQPNFDEALRIGEDTGRLSSAGRSAVLRAMDDFAATMLRWRRTHYRIAVRMLREEPGTGYTEGTPYLEAVRDIPVFCSVPAPGTAADGAAR